MDMYLDAEVRKYIDVDTGAGRVRGNKKLYNRMVGLFLQSAEFAAFSDAWNEKKAEEAANYAHAIKGMTGNLAMDPLFDVSTQLMNELRAGNFNDELYASYQEIYEATKVQAERLVSEPV